MKRYRIYAVVERPYSSDEVEPEIQQTSDGRWVEFADVELLTRMPGDGELDDIINNLGVYERGRGFDLTRSEIVRLATEQILVKRLFLLGSIQRMRP